MTTHITITGDLGSGKSTIAKKICDILHLKYLSTGSIQRELASQMGMNTLEFNKYSNENKEIDSYIDQKLKDINHASDTYVLDSRLGWHFVQTSFKIYVMAMDEVAAARVLKDGSRVGEPDARDLQGKISELKERRELENNRFEKIYGIRPSLFQDFDIIIDTSTATVEDITQLVVDLYQKHCKGEPYAKVWLSPIRLFPTNSYEVTHNEKESPIKCVLYLRNFFIVEGHDQVSEYINRKSELIPVEMTGKNEDLIDDHTNIQTFLHNHSDLKTIKEWEKKHQIKFFHYPDFLTTDAENET